MNIYFLLILFLSINLIMVIFFDQLKSYINILDHPNKRKLHKKPVPLLGGPLLFINLSIFILLAKFQIIEFDFTLDIDLFYLFCVLIFIIGILDDIYSLNPNNKLLIFIIIFTLYCNFEQSILIQNISLAFKATDINIGKFAFFFTIICFIAFINAFNMFDGINLQSSTYSIFLSTNLYYIDKNIFFLVLIIFLLFFSFLNVKEKSFLGNSGSYLLPFIFAVMFITHHNNFDYSADIIFVLMSIPGFELIRLTIYRIINGTHPFFPDRNHIHHLMTRKLTFKLSIILLNALIYFQLFIYLILEKTIISILIGVLTYSFFIFLLRENKNK